MIPAFFDAEDSAAATSASMSLVSSGTPASLVESGAGQGLLGPLQPEPMQEGKLPVTVSWQQLPPRPKKYRK